MKHQEEEELGRIFLGACQRFAGFIVIPAKSGEMPVRVSGGGESCWMHDPCVRCCFHYQWLYFDNRCVTGRLPSKEVWERCLSVGPVRFQGGEEIPRPVQEQPSWHKGCEMLSDESCQMVCYWERGECGQLAQPVPLNSASTPKCLFCLL